MKRWLTQNFTWVIRVTQQDKTFTTVFTPLELFKVNKAITMYVSAKNLWTALLQDGLLEAFKAKTHLQLSLDPEKALAILFGCEKFHNYQ